MSILSVNAAAQNQWSVCAGYLKSDNRGSSASNSSATITTHDYGFYAGVGLGFPVEGTRNLYFEGDVVYSYLGTVDYEFPERIHTLNLPLRVKYKVDLTNILGIFAYGGPVSSFGFAGSSKVHDKEYPLYGKDGILNRLDFKLGIGDGIEVWQKVVFRIGYDWGMLNASKNHHNSNKIRLNLLHVGVAYNI